jgi:hypothetical protein
VTCSGLAAVEGRRRAVETGRQVVEDWRRKQGTAAAVAQVASDMLYLLMSERNSGEVSVG